MVADSIEISDAVTNLRPSFTERRILEFLSEDGGFTTGRVAENFTGYGDNKRQRSGAVRSWLNILQKRGLVAPMDDLKPVAWVRTPAGTAALAHGST